MIEEYDDDFIENASSAELEEAGNEVYDRMQEVKFDSAEYRELSSLHTKLVDAKFEKWKEEHGKPTCSWTDKNRWE